MTTPGAGVSAPEAPTPGAPPENVKWWTLAAVCFGTFMLLLDITIVNVALPDIQKDLNSPFSGLQWVVDAYALTLAASLLTAGSLADIYGRRRLYLIGMGVFTLASLSCGLATSTTSLEISRGIQGVGGAIMFPVSLALLADSFRGRDRGVAFGIWGAITGLAVAVGPVVGGLLTSGISWRWIFFVNLPIGVVAIAMTVAKVRESRDPQARRPDWFGFLTFTASLAFLVYALIRSSEHSFTDTVVLVCFALAAVLMVAFIFVELYTRYPMFELALFRKPAFVGGSIAAFALSASIFSMLLYLTLYLQDVLRFSALGTGVRLLTVSAGILVASTIAGALSSRMPVRFLIGPGLLIVGISLLAMRGLGAQSVWTDLLAGLILGGIGVGMINPPLASTAVGVVPPRQAGMASGINSTFRQVGIATGIALLGSLFATRAHSAVLAGLRNIPGIELHASQIATALTTGQLDKALAGLPVAMRQPVAIAAASAFTTGLNRILLVAAIIALVGGVLALVLIRPKDFVAPDAH